MYRRAIAKGSFSMGKTREYIFSELKVIEKECFEKGITASEWVARYGEEFHKNHWNKNGQKDLFFKR